MYNEENYTYGGYELDNVPTWNLTKQEIVLLDTCIYLVDNGCTLRQAARDSGNYATSTLRRHIHTKLRTLSFELYKCVCRVLKHNETKKIGGVNFVRRKQSYKR